MCDLVGGRQIKSRHQLRVNNDLLLLITKPAGGEEKGFEWYRKMRYQDIEKGIRSVSVYYSFLLRFVAALNLSKKETQQKQTLLAY